MTAKYISTNWLLKTMYEIFEDRKMSLFLEGLVKNAKLMSFNSGNIDSCAQHIDLFFKEVPGYILEFEKENSVFPGWKISDRCPLVYERTTHSQDKDKINTLELVFRPLRKEHSGGYKYMDERFSGFAFVGDDCFYIPTNADKKAKNQFETMYVPMQIASAVIMK
jgi:hypothetical protein